jgi:Ca2+-binding EF-hand superfamily protein
MSFKSDSKDSYDSKADEKGYKEDAVAESKSESNKHFRLVIKDVREKLEEELGPGAHSGEAVRKFFSDFDEDGDGCVDQTEFRHAMRDIGIPVGDNEISSIYNKYAADGRTLNYSDFLALLDFTSKATVEEIAHDVRVAILEDLGPGAHCAARMKELFAEMDVDADGSITQDEFMRGMQRLNVPINAKEVDILYKRFDQDESGTIEYDEFIDMVGFQSRDEIMVILRDIREAIDDEARSTSPAAIKRVFSNMDENGDGKIDKSEFAKAMIELKVPVGDSQIDKIFDVYDTDNNGSFDYNEFLVLMEYTKHHHSSDAK